MNYQGSDNIRIEELDIAESSSIESAASRIGKDAIDSIIIVAGYVGGMPENQTIDNVDLDEWHRTLNINTIGPLLVARSFKENLSASGNGNLMILSSQLAASTWSWVVYVYSTTKAAVSKVGQILALDWAEDPIIVSIMHPGWVQTDMGGPAAEITAEESASGIRNVLSGLKKKTLEISINGMVKFTLGKKMKPVCLVLGAGAGIGGNVAKKFSKEGFHLCICRRTDGKGLNNLVKNIEENGGSALGF